MLNNRLDVIRMNRFVNVITRCFRCGSTLVWDQNSVARVLRLGNNNIKECLDVGCDIVKIELTRVDPSIIGLLSEPAYC
jgi:hypothetical protein